MTAPAFLIEKTAIVVVDPYNDFMSARGKLWPLLRKVSKQVNAIENLQRIVSAGRSKGIQIVYAPHRRYETGQFSDRKYLHPSHVGITASSDTFYPGQERYDTVSGRVLPRWRGSAEEWQALGVLNYEMESATLFTMCSANGWRAGCVAGVLVNRHQQETPSEETIETAERNAVDVVIAASRILTRS